MLKKWSSITQFTGDPYFQSMMGHGLTASSQTELTKKLVNRGFLQVSLEVQNAFAITDRAKFLSISQKLPQPLTVNPYDNTPMKITTNSSSHAVSTPQLHAQIISLLGDSIGPGKLAAEIGAGSGYLPAVMANAGCDRVAACETDTEMRQLCHDRLSSFPNIVVSDHVLLTWTFDAMYISPYFETEDVLFKFLEPIRFTPNATVVASVERLSTETMEKSQWQGQTIVALEKNTTSCAKWNMTPLFRVLGEAISV